MLSAVIQVPAAESPDALQHFETHGEVCPAGWTKGKDAINTKKAGEYFAKHGK